MPGHDPYTRTPPFVYECVYCAYRVEAPRQPAPCPHCDVHLVDLSIPRE